METESSNPASRRILRYIVLPLAALIALTVIFYVVEDLRGWHAWRQYKAESAARGVPLNWAKLVPPPVADDQNFFKQPNMQAWFVGRGGNPLSTRLSFGTFQQFSKAQENRPVAQVKLVPFDAHIAPGEADLILQYDYNSLTLVNDPANEPAPAASPIIPLIVMDEVPLTDAIKATARQINLNYQIDPSAKAGDNFARTVSVRWTNLTGQDALMAILQNYNLDLIPAAKNGVARIVKLKSGASFVHAEPVVSSALIKLLLGATANTALNGKARGHLTGASGLELAASVSTQIKPVRIIVRTDRTPSILEIKEFFPDNPLGNALYKGLNLSQVTVEPVGTNFNISLFPPQQIAAEDYLAWSDQFADDLTSIDGAAQLPYARMDGDYDDTVKIPIPNFVCLRAMAQTLSQRAQSHLLLNQPLEALRDLTQLHHLSRILEARPTGNPMTLIAAMVNVAVTGVYVSTVADGIRLHVWREPELAVLQQQLSEINLIPYLHDAFEFETEAHAHLAETRSSHQIAETFAQYRTPKFMDKLRDSTYVFVTLAPQGWVYQNVARGGRLQEGMLNAFDVTNHLIFPGKVDRQIKLTEKAFRHFTPYNCIIAQMIPNFSRAVQTAAKNQTLVNEGIIVCALERHRLAHGYYPESLDKLTPAYAAQFPTDIIGGAPLHYYVKDGQFTLYSIGWNERDDGGKPAWNDIAEGDVTQNDWVWPYQTRTEK